MERQCINSLFNVNPKAIYREFSKDSKVEATTPPSKENVRWFWDNSWGQPDTFSKEASCLPELRNEYCQNVETHIQAIKQEHFNQITNKLKDGNSPGRDLVAGYWIKHNHSVRQITIELYQKMNANVMDIPEWLVKARTTLVAKNNNSHEVKNYRPIACENIMMKVYSECLALFIEEHRVDNNIIFPYIHTHIHTYTHTYIHTYIHTGTGN